MTVLGGACLRCLLGLAVSSMCRHTAFQSAPPPTHTHAAPCTAPLHTQQLADFDERTGVVTAAKETTTAIAIKALDVLDKAAADKRVQSVVATAGTGW